MKYLLLVAVCVFAGMWLLRAAGPPAKSKRDSAKHERADSDATARDGEAMVRCGHCGVHFPRSEAVVDASGTFCSQEHRRQYSH